MLKLHPIGGTHLQSPLAGVYSTSAGGTLGVIATLPTTAHSFAGRHDASNNTVYYCSAADERLHRYVVTTMTDTAYPWPIPQMQCTSHSLVHSATRKSLIFAYAINGAYGFAEYLAP